MGLSSRAQHLTLSMPKKNGKSWGCALNMPDIVMAWWKMSGGQKQQPQKRITVNHPRSIRNDVGARWKFLVRIKSLLLANGCSQSGEKAHQTEENQSKLYIYINISTANTFADAAAGSTCLQTEQVLQHDRQNKDPFSQSQQRHLMLGTVMLSFLLFCYFNNSCKRWVEFSPWLSCVSTCFSRALVSLAKLLL